MSHLVRPIVNVDLATCRKVVVDSLAYLQFCARSKIASLSEHLDGPTWGANLKRQKVRLTSEQRPAPYRDLSGKEHTLHLYSAIDKREPLQQRFCKMRSKCWRGDLEESPCFVIMKL
jgi:hypothetical protein